MGDAPGTRTEGSLGSAATEVTAAATKTSNDTERILKRTNRGQKSVRREILEGGWKNIGSRLPVFMGFSRLSGMV